MKHLLVALGFLFTIAAFAHTDEVELIGTWKNETSKIEYEFKPNGNVIFVQNGQSVYVQSYTVDLTKSPGWIDFKIVLGPNEMVIPGLIQVVDENTIIIEQFTPSSEHPEKFSEREYAPRHILKREK